MDFPGQPESDVDDGLCLAATDVLRSSGYGQLKRLRCQVVAGVVTILGTVPSFFLKQLAQESILRLDQVRQIRNLVQVRRAELVKPDYD